MTTPTTAVDRVSRRELDELLARLIRSLDGAIPPQLGTDTTEGVAT
jgi:hypothetical protein